MGSVRSIAKRAGVSIATVSRVLNAHPQVSEKARRKVLAVAHGSGYVPAVGRRSTTNIAVVYTGGLSLGSPYDSAILQGMSQGLEAHGYDLLIINAAKARQGEEPWSQVFLRKGVAGVVVRTEQQTRGLCREILRDGIVGLVVADEFDDPAIATVNADSRKAVRSAIEHLVHLGHKRIAITLNVVDDHDHRQRLEAYRQVLNESGLGFDERLILRVPAYQNAGAASLRQIMGMPNRPTAVFVTDPMAGVGLFHEAQRIGVSIPAQLSVIGFDDSQQRLAVYPRMSAVCQDAERLGGEAMARLMRMIEHREENPASPNLECWLELNDSTAAPARAEP